MSGAVKATTPLYGFKLINFDFPSWGDTEHANWKIAEALLSTVGAVVTRGTWENSVVYTAGDRVVDADNTTAYLCEVSHTSATTGTFAADRTANASYWTAISSLPVWRNTWASSTIYNLGDVVVINTYDYYFCTTAHTSGAAFAGDSSNWQLIFQGSTIVTAAQLAKTNAETAETNAAASAIATAADAVNTNADSIATAADRVQTGLDRIATAADKVATNADVVLTNADVIATAADRVQTGLDVIASAASAAAAATFDPALFAQLSGATFTGVVQHISGTVSAPGITFTGDTDTGMWRPGANIIAWSTNGAERMRVDASGNVGIGTSAPNTRLEVAGDATNGLLRVGQFQIKDSAGVYSGAVAGVHIFPFTDGNVYVNNFSGGFVFRTLANLERMRIDSSGNVGIGIANPSHKLQVAGGQLVVDGTTGSYSSIISGTGDTYIRGGAAGSKIVIGDQNTGTVELTGPGNKIISGNVGIGTTAPTTALQVVGTIKSGITGTNGNIEVGRTSDGATLGTLSTDGSNSILNSATAWIFQNNTVEAMRIDSTGNLLIGTSATGASKLRISGLPTSAAGLSAGDVWNDGGTLKIA